MNPEANSEINNIAKGLELYKKACALAGREPLDRESAKKLIWLSKDAISAFGFSNQDEKVELDQFIKKAKSVLPPADLDELYKHLQTTAIENLLPINPSRRKIFYAVIGSLIGLAIIGSIVDKYILNILPVNSQAKTPSKDALSEQTVNAEKITLSGVVKNARQEPIPNVKITIDGLKFLAFTHEDGAFGEELDGVLLGKHYTIRFFHKVVGGWSNDLVFDSHSKSLIISSPK